MMTVLNLQEVQERVNQLAEVINAPSDVLPTFGFSEQIGRPHIEVDKIGYHYIVAERGNEIGHDRFTDIDDLLYKVFESITFEMSCRYELSHRIEEQDFRRIVFSHQVELLSQLSPKWANLEQGEHQRILKQCPFDDEAFK